MLNVGRPTSKSSLRSLGRPSPYYSLRNQQLAPLDDDILGNLKEPENKDYKESPPKPILRLLPQTAGLRNSRPLSKKDIILPPLQKKHVLQNYTSLPPLKENSFTKSPLFYRKQYNDPIQEVDETIEIQEEGSKIIRTLPWQLAQRPLTPLPTYKDTEINCVFSVSAIRKFSEIKPTEKVPPLPNVSDPNFEQILLKKIEICTRIFNFADIQNVSEEKDIKSRSLCEFVQFFEQSVEARKVPVHLQKAIFELIEKNVFEQIPVYPDVLLSANYSTVAIDSSWPHLFYCFQILNRFIQLYPESECIDLALAKRAIKLISVPDNNERLQLLAFLRTFYDLHAKERAELMKETGKVFNEYMEKQLPPYPVPQLLVFSAHMFTRHGKVLTKEFAEFLTTSVFPLINSEHIVFYYQHLIQLFNSVFIDGSEIIQQFFTYLLRHWNSANPIIMTAHVDLMIYTCSKLPVDIINERRKFVLNLLSAQLLSLHPRIVIAVLSLWLRPKLDSWVENDSKRAISYMYDNVKMISECYWYSPIHEKAIQTLAEMGKLDRTSFLKVRNQKGPSDFRKKKYEIEHKAMKVWAHLVKDIPDPDFNVKEKILEIKTVFDFKAQEKETKTLLLTPNK